MAKTQVNFRIDPDLLATVKGKAKEEKLDSYTQWIIDAIKMRLGELPPSSSPLDDRIGEVIDQRLEKLEGDIQLLDSVKQRVKDLETLILGYSCELPDKTAPTNNMPSQNSLSGTIDANQVSEAITVEIEPSRGIDAESEAGKGIQAKELQDILGVPQSTLSDWGKRRKDGKGQPSSGEHKDKWDEFMEWEKRDRKWYNDIL
jgi:hypothetical protein